uniref:LOW QUALITY PROTEIN: BRCA1-associated RING domain protein 1 n=1 Tax=Podarcis muralis TaxID=64176 RepID=UPI0010A088B8|nr:LOW QUALITY PROTEIN: BRCA1-associated RING domain protein 1 [Podarcis muralis]
MRAAAALRGRSGNQPEGRMEAEPRGRRWKETGAALARLAEALSCSQCRDILKKPVNIGGCEHVLCLNCVGDSSGTACPVCHVPAMVQDVKVNRQLDNIVKLHSKLQSLWGRDLSGSGENLSDPGDVVCETGSKKHQQLKEDFNPRRKSKKLTMRKRPEKTEQAVKGQDGQPHAPASTHDFSLSPTQEPFKEQKNPNLKKLRKKTLTDINSPPRLLKERQKKTSGHDEESTSEAKVVFCSRSLDIPSPDPKSTSEHKSVMRAELAQGESEVSVDAIVKLTEKSSRDNVSCSCGVVEENLSSEECLLSRGEMAPLKRRRQQSRLPTPLHKQPSRKEHSTPGSLALLKVSPRPSPKDSLGDSLPTIDCIRCYPPTPSASSSPTMRNSEHACNQKTSKTAHLSNTAYQKEAQLTESFSRKSPNSLPAKRNHKGETLLHIASVEGDLSAVKHLLKSGADPNVKDYAGWTPLHEACNHGHKEVVELLLQHGALLNAAGYQNDLPLHDAVKNGHTSIVELLLLHGASRNVVNIFGHKPVDYAETENMKSLLMLPAKNDSSTTTQCPEQLSLNQPREGPVVLLGSGLNPVQQALLSKLAKVLKARICMAFNSTVTHVVIPENSTCSTMKCMLAVLTGCWILTFQWVDACLKTGAREQEEKYEIDGGPRQGRLNKEQLLPKLFDGCYFYFLGMFKEHNKDDLKELVKAGGGQILLRKPKSDSDVTQTINTVAYHAEIASDQSSCTQYIIYDVSSNYKPEKIRQGKVWEAPSKWLIDCVVSFQLLPVKK